MMAKRLFLWLGILAAALSLMTACADPVVVGEPNECEGNSAPRLAELVLVVDHHYDDLGFVIEEPPSPDSSVFVSKYDRIIVWFRFRDKDCNIDGGQIFWSLDSDIFTPVTRINLTENQLCDGKFFQQFAKTNDEVDLPRGYGYEIPPEKLEAMDCSLHEFTIGITDACGAPSEETLSSSFFIRKSDC